MLKHYVLPCPVMNGEKKKYINTQWQMTCHNFSVNKFIDPTDFVFVMQKFAPHIMSSSSVFSAVTSVSDDNTWMNNNFKGLYLMDCMPIIQNSIISIAGFID